MNAQTKHLIGKAEFAKMNLVASSLTPARGGVVDQPALVEALAQRKIAYAALDVFEDEPVVPVELMEMDNVVLAPHIGSATCKRVPLCRI